MSSQGLEIMVDILRHIDAKQEQMKRKLEQTKTWKPPASRQQDLVLNAALQVARDTVTLGIEDAVKIEKAL